MANTVVKSAQLIKSNAVVAESGQAIAANTTKYSIAASGKNIVLCFVPSAAGTLKILKGDGFAAAPNDLEVTITASKGNWIELDSAPFMVFEGTEKGKIVVQGDGTVAGTLYVVNAL